MAEKWFSFQGADLDLIQAWFVATRKGGRYGIDWPFVGAVVYDYHHNRDRPLILTEFDPIRRRFIKIMAKRFENESVGDGSWKRPYEVIVGKKAKREIMVALRAKYRGAAWIQPEMP